MEYLDWDCMSRNLQTAVKITKEWAEQSVTLKGSCVGCSFILEDDSLCSGATVGHSRIVGSTCAERMAIDKVYMSKRTPMTCVVVGKLVRNEWNEQNICTPCGSCLEMIWEFLMYKNMSDIEIVCCSWDMQNILKTSLTELYPRIESVRKVYD